MTHKNRYNFHGDPERFPVLVDFIDEHLSRDIRYVADVAGGQGMLSKLLRKRLNLDAEVIDPRGYRMKSIPGQQTLFSPESASYYDLVIGLHPDQATQEIVRSALMTRTLIVPCCNFWDRTQRLGTNALIEAIEEFYRHHGVSYERVELAFNSPKNIALVTHPPCTKVNLADVVMPSLERPKDSEIDGRSSWWADRKRK